MRAVAPADFGSVCHATTGTSPATLSPSREAETWGVVPGLLCRRGSRWCTWRPAPLWGQCGPSRRPQETGCHWTLPGTTRWHHEVSPGVTVCHRASPGNIMGRHWASPGVTGHHLAHQAPGPEQAPACHHTLRQQDRATRDPNTPPLQGGHPGVQRAPQRGSSVPPPETGVFAVQGRDGDSFLLRGCRPTWATASCLVTSSPLLSSCTSGSWFRSTPSGGDGESSILRDAGSLSDPQFQEGTGHPVTPNF